MNSTDPTYLGCVSAVSGASLTVKLAESLASGLAIINGHTYRVAQVGSFVRIPQGYQDLYGVVSEVGATAAPSTIVDASVDTGRWMKVELWAENSPFDLKDVLKARGYRWNGEGTGAPRAWYIDVAEAHREREVAFLKAEIYQSEVGLLVRRIDAYDRFSERC